MILGMSHLVDSRCLASDHKILLPFSAMQGDTSCTSLQGLLSIEVQFTGLVVAFVEERIPVSKGFGQGVSLEEWFFASSMVAWSFPITRGLPNRKMV